METNEVVTITADALKVVLRSIYTAPNCITKNGSFPSFNGEIPFKRAKKLFGEDGPDTFLTIYLVTNGIKRLKPIDIARAYCLDHLRMVLVAKNHFQDVGIGDPYFNELRMRQFSLTRENADSYFYSCLGKVGEIVSISGDRAKVKTGASLLSNVVAPNVMLGQMVIVHFATAITTLPEKEAREIAVTQKKDPWYKTLLESVPSEIDYQEFCGRDLAGYAHDQLIRLGLL